MAQFRIVIYADGYTHSSDAGHWEAYAREQYGQVRRRMLQSPDKKGKVTLLNPEGEILLEHDQLQELE